jgi:hypothetical protein
VKYRATAAVSLPVGAIVKMAPEQMRRRRHLVGPSFDGGRCEVKAEFQFKTGEEFETGHVMSKGNTEAIVETKAAPAPAQVAAPAAEAPAKLAPVKAFAKR